MTIVKAKEQTKLLIQWESSTEQKYSQEKQYQEVTQRLKEWPGSNLSVAEMAQKILCISDSLETNIGANKPEKNLENVANLIVRLQSQLGGSVDDANIWLASPHPILNNECPLFYLLAGKLEVVDLIVSAMETGQPL